MGADQLEERSGEDDGLESNHGATLSVLLTSHF